MLSPLAAFTSKDYMYHLISYPMLSFFICIILMCHCFVLPDKENLCLYGLPDETWAVRPPDEAPPTLPEPALGINFARDGMARKHWLLFVAAHSDSWLLALAFYYGNQYGLDKEGRLVILFCRFFMFFSYITFSSSLLICTV
jgi:hypothetical protein